MVQLEYAVQELALPSETQLHCFPDFVGKADELALDFCNWFETILNQLTPGLTTRQIEVLNALVPTLVVLLVVSPLWSSASAQDEATDVAKRIVASLNRAWNSGDGRAWAAEYWPDSEFINIFGAVLDGSG